MRFRKKPIVIEAVQFNGANYEEVGMFAGMRVELIGARLFCKTLEGSLEVSRGDWIIKGVKGEFYPCKADIFEATYDLAD